MTCFSSSAFAGAIALLLLGACSSTQGAPGDASVDHHVGKDVGVDRSHPSDGHTGGDGGADARRDADAHPVDAPKPRDAKAPDAHHDVASADARRESGLPDAPVDAKPDAGHEAGYDAGPPALRYVGRTLTDGTSPDGNGSCTPATPCFEWSGTQVIARFTGATSYALTMSDYGNYFDVYVDGVLQGTPIVGSNGLVTVASGLTASAVHEVSLYKRTEASTNGRTMIQGYSFPNGGTLLPPAAPASRRIEVVGDSISCGYGVLGPNATCMEMPAYEDHDDSYGAITARNLGADLYTIASSGRGMYQNVDCTTSCSQGAGEADCTLPEIYGYTLPYVNAGVTPSSWSFSAWVPDVVVIDLGTNDFFCSEDSGGSAPGAAFQTTYLTFLKRVRANYPDAWIFCANGPMLQGADYTTAATLIQGAITMMADSKVTFVAVPTQTEDAGAQGCDGHPDPATQKAMATVLTSAIQTALSW